ncbi:DUF1657 domain-containing protein [Lederbergia citrea]|uniref:DUF1657 domain-containing protein n=1 Tax=Lederbergia citrea TaxID=2833581 RepID=A0A942Z419_9BACI|nr:DUF1657 domain-containing protein [Lederbergia citrea]MBS4203301.1 DUF1657 domain-containing protein [Lederbergia citrea]MBS4222027.1 DUF1657 domain-containing protein [Lederbergia citrea]
MTVFANVQGTLANMKAIQAELSRYAQVSTDEKAKAIFHDCMIETIDIIDELQQRIEFMKAEELQYRKS